MTQSDLPAAVLFDMDGTLIDSEGLWFESEISVMAEMGAAWTAEDQAYCLGGPLERVAEYMIERSGSTITADDVSTRLLDEMEGRLRSTPLAWQPGARDLVAECRRLRVPTALVSASWSRLIEAVGHRIEEDLGTQAFDVIVAGDDVAHSKPHPEPYLTAAAALGQVTGNCLALEDSPTGVRSARDAGCRVVAIPHIADVDLPGVAVIAGLEGRSLADLWGLTGVA